MQHGAGDILHLHDRRFFLAERPRPLRHAFKERRARIADVDLTGGDVIGPPIKAQRPGQASHAMLGGRVADRSGARGMGADRAVIDDPPALWHLRPHLAECHAGRIEHAGQVHGEAGGPIFRVDFVYGALRREDARIVEKRIEPAEAGHQRRHCALHGGQVGHIGGQDQRFFVALRHRLQRLPPPCQQTDLPARAKERLRRRPANARTCPGDQDHAHLISPPDRPALAASAASPAPPDRRCQAAWSVSTGHSAGSRSTAPPPA